MIMKAIYTLFFLFSCSCLLSAQELVTDSIELKEALVLSSYRASEVTPISFSNISLKEIEQVNFGQEPAFILNSSPSITTSSDAGSYSGYSYFRLRGIDQTRINMTLDGVPLNEPEDQGVYFSNFPDFFNSVHSIQIQRGTGLSSNGMASFAGSINFQSPVLHKKKKIELFGGYGSFNSYRAYAEMNTGVKNNLGLYARFSYIHSDGYKYHSGHDGLSGFVSGGWFKGKHILKYTGFIGHQKNEMAWLGVGFTEFHEDQKNNANSTEEFDEFLQHLSKIQHTYSFNENTHLSTSIFYNYLNGNYDFDLDNFLGIPTSPNSEIYNYDFNSHFKGIFSNLNFEKNNLKFNTGFHGQIYQRRHIGSEKTLGQLYENTGFKDEVSIFTKVTYDIKNWQLLADVQYRYTDFRYKGFVEINPIQWSFINPRIGASYQFKDKSIIYYNLGNTSREPTRNDIFLGNDEIILDDAGNPLLGNTKAENVWDNELGFKKSNDKFHLNVNLYYMIFNNEITLNGQFGPNGLPLHSNVAKSFRSGIELDFIYKTKFGLNARTVASYAYNRIKEEGVSFQPVLSPPLILQEQINYSYKGLNLGLTARYQDGAFIGLSNAFAISDFTTLDFMASYRYKFVELSFRLNNLTNNRTANSGQLDIYGNETFQAQAPINFSSGLKLIF